MASGLATRRGMGEPRTPDVHCHHIFTLEQRMDKRVIKVLAVILGIVAVLIIGFSIMATILSKDLRAVKELKYANIDLATIPNGEYYGEYKVNPISVKLNVNVENGKITQIDLLEHRNGKGRPAEAIIPLIIKEQRIDVSAISGATYSSNIIKEAIEIELKQASK